MPESDYLLDAVYEQWDNILKMYKLFENKDPIVLFDIQEQRIYVYPFYGTTLVKPRPNFFSSIRCFLSCAFPGRWSASSTPLIPAIIARGYSWCRISLSGILPAPGEAESGSAGVQPDKEYPGRGAPMVPWAPVSSTAGASFFSHHRTPSHASKNPPPTIGHRAMPRKTHLPPSDTEPCLEKPTSHHRTPSHASKNPPPTIGHRAMPRKTHLTPSDT